MVTWIEYLARRMLEFPAAAVDFTSIRRHHEAAGRICCLSHLEFMHAPSLMSDLCHRNHQVEGTDNMVSYQPILKAKPAELSAWENITSTGRLASSPLFELAPSEKVRKYLDNFLVRVGKSFARDEIVTIDASAIDQASAWDAAEPRIIEWLGSELASKSVRMRPVVRLEDPNKVKTDIALVAAKHKCGVTVRLGTDCLAPNIDEFFANLSGLLSALGIKEDKLHVLLDFRYIASDSDVSRAVTTLNSCLLKLAAHPQKFGSVHAAAGSFPQSISSLALGTRNILPRFEAKLYNSAIVPLGFELGFADYAVNNPSIGQVIPRGPLPSLRYLSNSDWIVWRERSPIGNEGFFTVCAAIVRDPAWSGMNFSWGDAQIERSSRAAGGAGTATQWRAYGTSHHVAGIVDRLASLGVP